MNRIDGRQLLGQRRVFKTPRFQALSSIGVLVRHLRVDGKQTPLLLLHLPDVGRRRRGRAGIGHEREGSCVCAAADFEDGAASLACGLGGGHVGVCVPDARGC